MSKTNTVIDENEIFKSLSHQIRRDIIKIIGNSKELTFTEIINCLDSTDSPTLSYHLKSLQPLLIQHESKYNLSEIGTAAYDLLLKTDQSLKISRYRKNFLYAYIITVICWISASTIIPFVYNANFLGDWKLGFIQIIITILSAVNYIIIWRLRKRY